MSFYFANAEFVTLKFLRVNTDTICSMKFQLHVIMEAENPELLTSLGTVIFIQLQSDVSSWTVPLLFQLSEISVINSECNSYMLLYPMKLL